MPERGGKWLGTFFNIFLQKVNFRGGYSYVFFYKTLRRIDFSGENGYGFINYYEKQSLLVGNTVFSLF